MSQLFISEEEKEKILQHGNEFFKSEENREYFRLYFIIMFILDLLVRWEGVLGLDYLLPEDKSEVDDILYDLIYLFSEGYPLDIGFQTEDEERIFYSFSNRKEIEASINRVKNNLSFIEDKDIQYITLLSLNCMEKLGNYSSNVIFDPLDIYLLSLIPQEYKELKNHLSCSIKKLQYKEEPDFYDNKTQYYINIEEAGLNKEQLEYIKYFFNKEYFYYKCCAFGTHTVLPKEGVIKQTEDKYLLDVKVNKDGRFDFVTSNEPVIQNCNTEYSNSVNPYFRIGRSFSLVSKLSVNGKEIWYRDNRFGSENKQLTPFINGTDSQLCSSIITYKRNGIPYFYFDEKEYNGVAVYEPVQGFVYLEDGKLSYFNFNFASHNKKDFFYYDAEETQKRIDHYYFISHISRSEASAVEYKVFNKLTEIYKSTIIALCKQSLEQIDEAYNVVCDDKNCYIVFKNKREYIPVSIDLLKNNSKKIKELIKQKELYKQF